MQNLYYLLKDRKITATDSIEEWAKSFTSESKRIAATELPGYWVSTVFLGLDHSFDDSGAPVLFETMVFPEGTYDETYMERYCTIDEAEAGHAKIVKAIEAILADKKIPDYNAIEEQLTKET